MSQTYNQFNTYNEALLPAILDTMQFMRDYNDDNGYTDSMFGTLEKYQELDAKYQQYLDGTITSSDVLQAYDANKELIRGKWSIIQEGVDGKFYYVVYPGSLNSYTTVIDPEFPVEEEV